MHRIVALLMVVVAAASCRSAAGGSGPAIVQPGAPGEPARVIAADRAADLSGVTHSAADVRFMQGMIHHHAQALDMVGLLDTRTASEAMRALGRRIELSQRDEIAFMRQWLQARGEDAPDEHAHHLPGAPLMPGMLSPQEMDRLAAATGVEFDRLFLDFMIGHHDGAIAMVDDLLASPDAAQESEIFAFTSDVVADQRAEMERMAAMLAMLEELHK